jgi:acyl carrier protein
MPIDRAAVEATVRRFLRTELARDDADVGADTALVTSGLLDSIALVRLAVLLEKATGLRIPDRDIGADHFDSLGRMLAYLEGRVRG